MRNVKRKLLEMEKVSVIRHLESEKAIWINTTDLDRANTIARDFLENLGNSDTEFRIKNCSIWKKDASLTKCNYSEYVREGSDSDIRKKGILKRMHTLVVIDRTKDAIENEYYLNTLENLQGTLSCFDAYWFLKEISELEIGEGCEFNKNEHYDDGSKTDMCCHLIRIS